jgi:hypothetical protein
MLERHILLEVLAGGEEILLEDGSKWRINPDDISTVGAWPSWSVMQIKLIDEIASYSHELTNMRTNTSVRARRGS